MNQAARTQPHAALAYVTPEEFEHNSSSPASQNSPVEPVDTAGGKTNRHTSDSLSSLEIRAGFPLCPPSNHGDVSYTENRTPTTPDRCP